MIDQLSAAYASAKAALDIAQGIQSLNTETKVNQAVIDIQRHVIDAQRGLMDAEQIHTGLLKKIEALEAEIMRMKDWSAEQERYELADTGQGSFAYRIKPGMENGEPPHWICPNCYQDGKKSIMKEEILPVGSAHVLACHPCGFDCVTQGVRHEQIPSSWNRRR